MVFFLKRCQCKASLPPLHFTLTHFTHSSYEWALHLPTSFPISDMARLGVKPRLCRSSWRAFASTHPLMLPSTSPREALACLPPLFGICLPSLWSPPFLLHSFTLISSLVEVQLSLPPHDLILRSDSSVPFPFDKGSSDILANCFLCGTEATLFFSAGPVCSSFSAKACAILHALCWSRQHQQVCHFSSLLLLSDSRSVLTTLSSPPSFLLPQTLWQIWQELSSLSSSIRLQWIPGHSFLPGERHG